MKILGKHTAISFLFTTSQYSQILTIYRFRILFFPTKNIIKIVKCDLTYINTY